VLKYPR